CCEVIPVPVLQDNYAYLVIDKATQMTACVDPAEPRKVLAAAAARGVTLSTLLCTHKHADHAGGNAEMARRVPGLSVVGSALEDAVPAVTRALRDGETVELGELIVKSVHTPCHTRGHAAFLVTHRDGDTHGAPVLFSGDTLFVGGCGRFFEGDAQDMLKSLGPGGSLWDLPLETRVYCGHEYTVSNLEFAATIEPDNAVLRAKLEWAKDMVADGQPTIPSTIGEELAYNPFMRTNVPEVMAAVGASTPVECMAALRARKDVFRPPPSDASRFPRL
ncbi:beta-lactamase-like protein, partial [Tribonema minus]